MEGFAPDHMAMRFFLALLLASAYTAVGGTHIDEDIRACPALPDFKAFFDQVLAPLSIFTLLINKKGFSDNT